MLNGDFSEVSSSQLGRISEYIARIEFARRGYSVFVPEVDDRGVDILTYRKDKGYRRVQVKSIRGFGYVFMRKTNFYPQDDFDLFLIIYIENRKDTFIIPSNKWLMPCKVFCDRDYENGTSSPEYGIKIFRRNYEVLSPFRLSESQHFS